MNIYLQYFKNCFKFSGREGRESFMLISLINISISLILSYLSELAANPEIHLISLALPIIMSLPLLALSVRRLHDSNRSGWWVIIPIPFIAFVLCLLNGTKGPNRFGDDPKNKNLEKELISEYQS